MQSNSELANSWNIKQNSNEENLETDIEDNLNETSSEEPFSSNKSLTKYELILIHLCCILMILFDLFIYTFLDYYYLI